MIQSVMDYSMVSSTVRKHPLGCVYQLLESGGLGKLPGFRVAACGLARNDERSRGVIPAKAGIQDFVIYLHLGQKI
jgi:hypothetical protein